MATGDFEAGIRIGERAAESAWERAPSGASEEDIQELDEIEKDFWDGILLEPRGAKIGAIASRSAAIGDRLRRSLCEAKSSQEADEALGRACALWGHGSSLPMVGIKQAFFAPDGEEFAALALEAARAGEAAGFRMMEDCPMIPREAFGGRFALGDGAILGGAERLANPLVSFGMGADVRERLIELLSRSGCEPLLSELAEMLANPSDELVWEIARDCEAAAAKGRLGEFGALWRRIGREIANPSEALLRAEAERIGRIARRIEELPEGAEMAAKFLARHGYRPELVAMPSPRISKGKARRAEAELAAGSRAELLWRLILVGQSAIPPSWSPREGMEMLRFIMEKERGNMGRMLEPARALAQRAALGKIEAGATKGAEPPAPRRRGM